MKRNKLLRGAGVLLITTILLFTTIVVTAETNEQQMDISTHIAEQTHTS